MITDRLIIVNHNTIDFINPYNVVYCKSIEANCTAIYLASGKKVIIKKTLIILQRDLPSLLIRVSQGSIINKLFIESIDKKKKVIYVAGNIEIPFTMAVRDLLSRIKETHSERSVNMD